jgi:hypothetical protein
MTDLDILVPLSAIIFGSLMFLIPIAALSLRFAAKPMVQALTSWREAQGGGEQLLVAKERIAFLEQRVEALEEHVGRLDEARDFDRRLAQDATQAQLASGAAD